jgi:hypothetical protein
MFARAVTLVSLCPFDVLFRILTRLKLTVSGLEQAGLFCCNWNLFLERMPLIPSLQEASKAITDLSQAVNSRWSDVRKEVQVRALLARDCFLCNT